LKQLPDEIVRGALTLQAVGSVLDAPGARCFYAGGMVSAIYQDRSSKFLSAHLSASRFGVANES
jgi:hypothetical protein